MDYKTFRRVNKVIALIFGAIVAISVATDNLILAAISAVAMASMAFILRKKTKGIIDDERDYANVSKAARMAVGIFSVGGATIALALLFMHYETIGYVIAYCVCALMLIHSAFSVYYEKQN